MDVARIQDDLAALGRSDLQNYRVKRYHGDNLCVAMSAFTDRDKDIIRMVYGLLQQLFTILRGDSGNRAVSLRHFLAENDIAAFVDHTAQLGQESYRVHPTEMLAKTIHDIRGGGLTPLLGQLQLCVIDGENTPPYDALFFLTRDHLKIMRNALLGLDDVKRNEDLQTKIHGTDFIVQKWSGAVLHSEEKETRLQVDCPEEVAITECCVEFGALDRILYNLLNNACRHAVGEQIQLVIFRVPERDGINLRFVLLNRITSTDEQRLRQMDLRQLFRTGVSTTGSGYGLNVAAEFVAHAFGIKNPEDAVEGEYLGAKLLGDRFAIWFHWPIVTEC